MLVLVHLELGMGGGDLVDEVDDLVVDQVFIRGDLHQDATLLAGYLQRRHGILDLSFNLLALNLQVVLRCHYLHFVELGVLEVMA